MTSPMNNAESVETSAMTQAATSSCHEVARRKLGPRFVDVTLIS
jgi:hypothetical protein